MRKKLRKGGVRCSEGGEVLGVGEMRSRALGDVWKVKEIREGK